MRRNTDVLRRLGAGKALGLAVGLVGFFLVPVIWPEAGLRLRWGVLLWYATFGVLIGLFGVLDRHPLLRFPMPFWFRGLILGAWLNFVLALFAYEQLVLFLANLGGPFTSPFWIVAEGAVIGIVIDAVATRVGGEGPMA